MYKKEDLHICVVVIQMDLYLCKDLMLPPSFISVRCKGFHLVSSFLFPLIVKVLKVKYIDN